MHEIGICQELVSAALAAMKTQAPPGARLRKARVVVGALRQIVPESLTFAFEVLTRGTPAEGATLEIAEAPVILACRRCGWQGEIEELLFRCGVCGAAEVDVRQGMEICLERLEVEHDEDAGDQGLS